MTPQTIHVERDHIDLTWSDGTAKSIKAHTLRCNCPCASCVSEATGQRTLDTSRVPQTITFTKVEPTGNYALTVFFSDFHNTGIFSYEFLKSLSRDIDKNHPQTA